MQCGDIVSRYLKHLSEGFTVEPLNGGCLLHTPYLDPDNDPITISIEKEDGRFRISDQTETLGYLFLHGIDIQPASKQRWYLDTTLRRLGVEMDESELSVISSEEELPDAIFRLIEAMKSAQHLTFTAKTRSHMDFSEEVSTWLMENQIASERRKEFVGASGKPVYIDFVVERSARKPPAFIKALHCETQHYASILANRTVVGWFELRGAKVDFESFCILDDTTEEDVWKEQYPLLKTYTNIVEFWDERDELLGALV
jgi:hypothetical protein